MQCAFMSELALAPTPARRLWARVLGRIAHLDDEQTRVARRGFKVERPEVVERLESIGEHFAWGYNHGVRCCELDQVCVPPLILIIVPPSS